MYGNIKAAVVGSINADLILKMEKIPEAGENVLGTDYGYANGGKGANQATALARLGAKTKMIGKVGSDSNGEKLIENLKKAFLLVFGGQDAERALDSVLHPAKKKK